MVPERRADRSTLAVTFAAAAPLPLLMLAWFVGALLGHDLVLYPLYALADRSSNTASKP